MKKYLLPTLVLSAMMFAGCSEHDSLLDSGVSIELAEHRKATIIKLEYDLTFVIPADKDKEIEGSERLTFSLKDADDVILDFSETKDKLHSVTANGESCDYMFVNEHIVIPGRYLHSGRNTIDISFTAGDQSLNRRDDFMYTLFVPDRARTTFPCMDQPNLKASFSLKLKVPEHWRAVSNGKIVEDDSKIHSDGETSKTIVFAPTEPLPTYLFAFAAGEFFYKDYEENSRHIGMYYRETDSLKVAQLPEIGRQIVHALTWQEEFTQMPFPFQKYDIVIIPGFQFGGMEHTGCTFYADNNIFLSQNPTIDEELDRTSLISHETSHMWFGDAVTMEWFNDVWTKEVFANYFAAEITKPLFPSVNHDLNWLVSYVDGAYSQDRTDGRTSIRQDLPNLRYAGLIYNDIIYEKAPVMMKKLVALIGEDAFRSGIRRYVSRYKYGNATWDDLIDIFDEEVRDRHLHADVRAFSREWVDEANWPHFSAKTFRDGCDGETYGFIELTEHQIDSLLDYWPGETDAVARQALLMNINENYLNGNIPTLKYLDFICEMNSMEMDPLTHNSLLTNARTAWTDLLEEYRRNEVSHTDVLQFERHFWQLTHHNDKQVRRVSLKTIMSCCTTAELADSLYEIWHRNDLAVLTETDFMTLAYELAVRMPERADEIISVQRSRIKNPDRLSQFNFISRAVSPSIESRDSLFESFRNVENRRIEPWTKTCLHYLCHPLRNQGALKYIKPALELMPEIQRTGDIFFPYGWSYTLLADFRSKEAYDMIEEFLAAHDDYPQLLKNKILAAKYNVGRMNNPPYHSIKGLQ